MKNVAVVIPIYKWKPSDDELASLHQCKNILCRYPIILVCPTFLNTSAYKFLDAKVIRFDGKWFKSVKSYSRLLLTSEFYQNFSEYNYILIYQADGWVFKDELDLWCEQGYDYIGAPWFENFEKADEKSKILDYIGNGGMSLRNVQKHIKMFEDPFMYQTYAEIKEENKKHRKISNILNIPVNVWRYIEQYFVPFSYRTKLNEDFFIAKYAQKLVPDFKFPTPEVAAKFAAECCPRKIYEMNNRFLPFLCHAFRKYDFEFWKDFINLEKRDV